jgi:hypothetical protein
MGEETLVWLWKLVGTDEESDIRLLSIVRSRWTTVMWAVAASIIDEVAVEAVLLEICDVWVRFIGPSSSLELVRFRRLPCSSIGRSTDSGVGVCVGGWA